MLILNVVLLAFLINGSLSAWIPGQWVDDSQLKIWDEFMASRGAEWDSAASSDHQPAPTSSVNTEQYPAVQDKAVQVEDKHGGETGHMPLPCGCLYHSNVNEAKQEVKPSCGCVRTAVTENTAQNIQKAPLSQSPIFQQTSLSQSPIVHQTQHSQSPIIQQAQLSKSSSVQQTPYTYLHTTNAQQTPVEKAHSSCDCTQVTSQEPILVPIPPLTSQLPISQAPIVQQAPHSQSPIAQQAHVETSHSSCGCSHVSSQEPILVPVPPLSTQLPVEQVVKQSCACSQGSQQAIDSTQTAPNPQTQQHSSQCGCQTNEPISTYQPTSKSEQETPPNCNQRPNPHPIPPISYPIPPISQPTPPIPQPKRPIIPRLCKRLQKMPNVTPLEHLNSYSQNNNPSVHHVSSAAAQNQNCECTKTLAKQNNPSAACHQAPILDKTVTNPSAYQQKPHCQQYQPNTQTTNQNAACRCSSCSKTYDWSNQSNGRRPLDWVKHLLPF